MHGIEFIQDLAVVLIIAGAVGWACKRAGLSVVVGYLVAGMVIGPYTPPFSLVHEADRVETLAQLGLVFLMFGIGLHLSLRRLRQMGMPLVVATVVHTLLIYYFSRVFGAAMGWKSTHTLYLAGMLMVSSSAIIGKILVEAGATHERVGQAAMSLTVAEDVVAVAMLTLLGSVAKFGAGPAVGSQLGETIGVMVAFVVLTGVASLLFVPWLLRRLAATASGELMTLCMAGVLLGLAAVAARAGYSLALGAFLLGCVVAETVQRAQVERTFEGLHDVFSAVFFVAIGMQIDLRMLGAAAGLIVVVSLFSLLLRPLTCMAGFVVAGTTPREALRIGLVATPIGEFSLIIAQLGVGTGVLPAKFYPLAVGVSLLTSVAAPPLTRNSARIATTLLAWQPRWFEAAANAYQEWLQRLRQRGQRSQLWQLGRRRLVHIAVEVLLVSGLVVFSEQLLGVLQKQVRANWLFPHSLQVFFWLGLGFVALLPLVAIWRNVSVLALLAAEVLVQEHRRAAALAPLVETTVKAFAGAALFLWLSALLPLEGTARWIVLTSVLVAIGALLLLWRRFVYWHSRIESELSDIIEPRAEAGIGATSTPWLAEHGEWHLTLAECVLPDLAEARARTLGDLDLRSRFGAVVVGIERQGVTIGNPGAETALYPRDKLLLLGDARQTAEAREFLQREAGAATLSRVNEMQMETAVVPAASRLAGATLAELGLSRRFGVQVAGIARSDGRRILNPGGDERLTAADHVLVLGRPDQIAAFKTALSASRE